MNSWIKKSIIRSLLKLSTFKNYRISTSYSCEWDTFFYQSDLRIQIFENKFPALKDELFSLLVYNKDFLSFLYREALLYILMLLRFGIPANSFSNKINFHTNSDNEYIYHDFNLAITHPHPLNKYLALLRLSILFFIPNLKIEKHSTSISAQDINFVASLLVMHFPFENIGFSVSQFAYQMNLKKYLDPFETFSLLAMRQRAEENYQNLPKNIKEIQPFDKQHLLKWRENQK